MIVRQFLQWQRTASAGQRADATSALAQAYLYSDLSEADRSAAEGAMMMLLDDPVPMVRRALAEVLAASEAAPPAIVHSLAHDQTDIASLVLTYSPLFLDADLVEVIGQGDAQRQIAIAWRDGLPASVCAAIAEVGCAEVCLVLLENESAALMDFSTDRIVERYGHLPPIRDAILARTDVAAHTRQALVAKLSQTLAHFVTDRDWLGQERAARVTREACEKATVALAADAPTDDMSALVQHLRQSEQLTGKLLLRALLSGHMRFVEASLTELSGLPAARVVAILQDRRVGAFHALYCKAGLPASAFAAFREALDAMRGEGGCVEHGHERRLKRRVVERVLTRCEAAATHEIEPLLTLLRRYVAEAAREDARAFCDKLVAENFLSQDRMIRIAA